MNSIRNGPAKQVSITESFEPCAGQIINNPKEYILITILQVTLMKKNSSRRGRVTSEGKMQLLLELEKRNREFGNDSNELIPDISGACYSQLSAGSFSTLLTNEAMKADMQDSSIQARSPPAGFIYELASSALHRVAYPASEAVDSAWDSG